MVLTIAFGLLGLFLMLVVLYFIGAIIDRIMVGRFRWDAVGWYVLDGVLVTAGSTMVFAGIYGLGDIIVSYIFKT